MITPFILWCAVATAASVILLLKLLSTAAIVKRVRGHHTTRNNHVRLIENGREREIFYVPGDIYPTEDNDDDDNDVSNCF